MGNQNQDKFNQTSTTAAATETATANKAPTNGADDMLCLMEQNRKTCCLGQWMKCLRKPAISMQYKYERRLLREIFRNIHPVFPVQSLMSEMVLFLC